MSTSTGQGKEASRLLQKCMSELKNLKAENEELKLKLRVATDYTEALKAENGRLRRLFSAKPAVSSQRQLPPGFRTSEPRSD